MLKDFKRTKLTITKLVIASNRMTFWW
uniref:Uncharacterized protein n=1 Tax=Rhizophora mucronata TaxID=61149 RepID=A0A2P2JDY4_RHIMU